MKNTQTQFVKAAIFLVISLGLLWFLEQFSPVTAFEPESMGWKLWMSYANDLILPFSLYFFLCLWERWLKTWQVRALLAFLLPTLIEFGQALYLWLLEHHYLPARYVGSFDWMDILVYAISVGLAVIVEQKVFVKLFSFWEQKRVYDQ